MPGGRPVDRVWARGLGCPRAYAQALWWEEKGVGHCTLESPDGLLDHLPEDEAEIEESRVRFGQREIEHG